MADRNEMEKHYADYMMETREGINGAKGIYTETAKLPYFDHVRPGHVNKEWEGYVSADNLGNRKRDMIDAILTYREMYGNEQAIEKEIKMRNEEEEATGITVYDKNKQIISEESYLHLDNYRNRPSVPKINKTKREEAMFRLANQEKRCDLGIFLE